MADPNIMDAARAGAPWAWERIYKSIAPEVKGFLVARGAVDPDGLLGEVFLNVAKGIGSFSGDESDFRAWVFTITRRRLIDERRYWKRRRHSSLEAAPEPVSTNDVATEGTESTRRAEIMGVLDTLTSDQRDVMLLRIVAGLTLAETSQVVGKSVNAVKVLQHRAVGRLRKSLVNENVTL